MVTRAQAVTERLRELVLDGTFPSATHLQEVKLARELQVSRTPVRNALSVLAAEGLLVYSPNRGYVVRQFTIDDILDAFDTRAVLEGLACRVAGERGITDEAAHALSQCLEQSAALLYRGRWSERKLFRWLAINREFHGIIDQFAGNRYLLQAVRLTRRLPRIHDQLARTREYRFLVTLYQRKQCGVAHDEHASIYEALLAGDGELAEARMRAHVYRNRETMRRNFAHIERESAARESSGDPVPAFAVGD